MWFDDRPELVADAHVLVHRALTVLGRQRVPGAELHERVDDEVRRAARGHLARLSRLRVLRGLRRREVRVRRLEPAGDRRPVQRRAQLAEVLVAVGDLPEEEVAVGADAGHACTCGASPSGRPSPRRPRRRRPCPPRAPPRAGAATPGRRGRTCRRRTDLPRSKSYEQSSSLPSRAAVAASRIPGRLVFGFVSA